MEEISGQQYALQVAVQTMKERCLQLQQRLSIVEEENMNLRVKYHIDNTDLTQDSNEIETLHQKIAQLTKQKSQLTHNVLMVATENRHLWTRLSKLTQTNQTLGEHLTKINDTLNLSTTEIPTTSTLIRSKTFTHESPTKLIKRTEEETSLEDISLKIINSIAQEKYELEKQCAQMAEMQSSETFLSNSIGFAYPLDVDEFGEFAENMEKLIYIKDSLIHQRNKLKEEFNTLKNIAEGNTYCKSCINKMKTEKESLKTKNIEQATISKLSPKEENEKICPVCSKMFKKDQVSELIQHVQSHFSGEDDPFLDHYEVVTQFS